MTDGFGRFTQIFQPQESLLDEQGMPVQTGLMGMNPTLLGLATGLLEAGAPTVGAPTPVSTGLSRGLTNAMAFQQAANQQAMQQAQFVRQQQEAQRQQQLMQRRQQALQTLSGGDPRMMAALEIAPGQVVGTMLPQEQDPTSLQRNLIAAGFEPGSEEFQQAMTEAVTRPQSQTTVNMPAVETEQRKQNAKFLAQTRQDVEQAATAAQRAQMNVNRAKQLIRTADPNALAPLRLQAQRFLRPLGVDVDTSQMSAGEALQSVGTGFVMDQIQNTKGAVSDAEMRIFAQAAPGLGRSREGNLLMLELLEAKNKRDIMLAKEQRKYAKERGGLIDFGWFDRRDELIAQNPLFTEDVRDRIDQIQGGDAFSSAPAPVETTRQKAPPQYPEGSTIRSKRTGEEFLVRDGELVPLTR